MRVSEIHKTGRLAVSFELFPPRGNDLEGVWGRMMRMAEAAPDRFTVTYGASGASREGSEQLIRRLQASTSIPVLAHVTCVASPAPSATGGGPAPTVRGGRTAPRRPNR